MNLTEKQHKLYRFISDYFADYHTAPSYDEMREYMSVSSYSPIQKLLRQLEKKGFIHIPMGSNQKRALTLTTQGNPGCKIPMLGEIAAGKPLEAILQESTLEENQIEIPQQMLHPPYENYFALTIHGDSMIGDGIFDGDTVIIKKQSHANNGQIAAVSLSQHGVSEVTLKHFHQTRQHIELRPSNENLKSIIIPLSSSEEQDVHIFGVLSALLRKY